MDLKAKADELAIATIAAADELLSSLDGERLYAICLQTAEDGLSVAACANTEEGYAEKRASEAEFEDMTPAYEAYLRWAPAEWRFEGFADVEFEAVNRDLTNEVLSGPTEGFADYFSALVDAMVEALAQLRAARGQELAEVTLFVTISDSEESEAVERRSAPRLNPPAVAETFLRRFG